MKITFARWTIVVLIFHLATAPAPARELGWQPQKTWVFVVGVLSWKHADMFGSFPVKNRRDAALVEFFKQSGVPASQIVYLQDRKRRSNGSTPLSPGN